MPLPEEKNNEKETLRDELKEQTSESAKITPYAKKYTPPPLLKKSENKQVIGKRPKKEPS